MPSYCFVPARGNSARLPGKNLADVGGLTLTGRACLQGLRTCDRVVLSTDCERIANEVQVDVATSTQSLSGELLWQVHMRPGHLAGPKSQIEEAIAHWLRRCDPVLEDDDVILLAQPTSPLRRDETIRECLRLVQQEGYDSATTVIRSHRNATRLRSYEDGTLKPLWARPIDSRPRSQDDRTSAFESGIAWCFTVRHFRQTKLRQGGREALVLTSPWEAVEIDSAEDLAAVRELAGWWFGQGAEAAA